MGFLILKGMLKDEQCWNRNQGWLTRYGQCARQTNNSWSFCKVWWLLFQHGLSFLGLWWFCIINLKYCTILTICFGSLIKYWNEVCFQKSAILVDFLGHFLIFCTTPRARVVLHVLQSIIFSQIILLYIRKFISLFQL